jgi:hypothetical protein
MADSKTQNRRRLHYLDDLKDYRIVKDEPDIRGWEVQDANRQVVGTVSDLLVDISREKVRYIDVDIDDDLLPGDHDPFSATHEDGIHEYQDKDGSIHMIIPIGVAHIERDQEVIVADGIDQVSLRNIPTYRYRKNVPVHTDYEQNVMTKFRDKSQHTEEERRDITDDKYYDSEYFNEDKFYGRQSE